MCKNQKVIIRVWGDTGRAPDAHYILRQFCQIPFPILAMVSFNQIENHYGQWIFTTVISNKHYTLKLFSLRM